jgi:2'-5' RNA ligase
MDIGSGGRPVAWRNLHMTLVFLGMTNTAQRLCMENAAESISLPAFELVLDQFGHWPVPQVLWLGCSYIPETLRALAEQLNAAMPACGLEMDKRPYQPHVTVQRKSKIRPEYRAISPLHWSVHEFVLLQPCSFPDGVRYQPLRRWPLRG